MKHLASTSIIKVQDSDKKIEEISKLMCDERDRRIGSILAERDNKIGKKIDKTFDMVTAQF